MWKDFLIGIRTFAFWVSICSCVNQQTPVSQKPVFSLETNVTTHILTDTALIAYPYDICVDDSCLYILSLVEDHWVQVYDKNSGEFLCSGIRVGQGPNDVANGSSLCFDKNTKLFYLYDQAQSKLITFSFDKQEKRFIHVQQQLFVTNNGVARMAWALAGNRYLVDGQIGETVNRMQRFQIYDIDSESSHLVARYDSFPVPEADKDIIFILASKSLSPDKKKLAVGTLWGSILETFQISDRITPIATQQFYPIDIRFEDGAVRSTEQTIYGFTSLLAFDSRIYGIWIGDKNPNLPSAVVTFDWDGNGLSKYNTDCILLRICKESEDSNRMYAVAASEERGFYIVYFDIA